MFMLFYRLIKGYLEIEAKGFSTERFINLAAHNSIRLWDIHKQTAILCFKADVRDFRRLCVFAKKAGVKLKIIKRYGCPFFIYRSKKRHIFSAGIIIFALLLLFMSSFIWLIDIEGNEDIEDYRILSVLNEKGLRIGALKYPLNTEELEKYVKTNIDGISYLHIKIEGTRTTVTVTEDIKNPDININTVDSFNPCDIISDKTALITDIIVTAGKPMVKPGDMVKEGDVLISADVTYQQDGTDVLYSQVYSSGTVRGKVTRTFTKTVPYTINLKRYTQNKAVNYNIKIFNTNFNTNFLKNDASFEKYDIIREINQLGLGEKFMLPIIIEKESCREYRLEKINISPDEAKELAAIQLNKQIIAQYPPDCDILDKSFTFIENSGNLIASIKVVAIENIGKESYIVPNTTQGGNAINGTTENADSE